MMVTDEHGKLLGILCHKDYQFIYDRTVPVESIMTKQVITASPNLSRHDAKEIFKKHKIEKVPLVDEGGRLTGLIVAKEIVKQTLYPYAARDKKGRLLVGAAVGMNEDCMGAVSELIEAGVDVVVLDSPNGFSHREINIVKDVKKTFPKVPIIAGSVDGPEGVRWLIEAGADAVKVGIGCGSACEMRPTTGFGRPQLSALARSVAVADGKPIIADGGVKEGHDIAKALAAGVNCIMSGYIFSGTDETPGRVKTITIKIEMNGKELKLKLKVKVYYGSASEEAQFERYIKNELEFIRSAEGEEYYAACKGPLKDAVEEYLGWLRSSKAFAGARTLQEFREITKFELQTRDGYEEGQ